MRDERLEVSVTFEPAKGSVATVPDLAEPITALSLAVLRRRPRRGEHHRGLAVSIARSRLPAKLRLFVHAGY
jgi:hypothetical protein